MSDELRDLVVEAFAESNRRASDEEIEECVRIGSMMVGAMLYAASFSDVDDDDVLNASFQSTNALDQLTDGQAREVLGGMLKAAALKARSLTADLEAVEECLPRTMLFLLDAELVNPMLRGAKRIARAEFERILAEGDEDEPDDELEDEDEDEDEEVEE